MRPFWRYLLLSIPKDKYILQRLCPEWTRAQCKLYQHDQGLLSYFSFEQYSGNTHNFRKISSVYVRGFKRELFIKIWLRWCQGKCSDDLKTIFSWNSGMNHLKPILQSWQFRFWASQLFSMPTLCFSKYFRCPPPLLTLPNSLLQNENVTTRPLTDMYPCHRNLWSP